MCVGVCMSHKMADVDHVTMQVTQDGAASGGSRVTLGQPAEDAAEFRLTIADSADRWSVAFLHSRV